MAYAAAVEGAKVCCRVCWAALAIAGLVAASQPASSADATEKYQARREAMVAQDIRGRDIRAKRVLQAMRKVPRHLFVPEHLRDAAYLDEPLPIGYGQTISQPYIVAFMTEVLDPRPEHKVLEIGTGSGYQAAVLAGLVKEVYTIEIVEPLGIQARQTLRELGYSNVHVRVGDGYLGWPEEAPFDSIIVTAAPEEIPQTLIDQLKPGGRMAIPVGPVYGLQEIILVRKDKSGKVKKRAILPVRFVPMVEHAGEPAVLR